MRKGELYFNWIFVAVIGAVFLAFFAGFAIKYKDLQEKKTEMIFLDNLDSALTNLQSSSFTTITSIELPLNININCGNNGYNIFINEKNNVDYLLASESNLKNKVYVWYQPYNIPFKVTNFYYLIDDKINIAANNVQLINSMKEEMPEEFKSRINVYQGNNLIINGNENQGNILIDGKNIPYLGKEMLYAAMLSNNYSCFYNNVKKELNKAVSIYENKAQILSRSRCNYGLVLSKINMLRDFSNVNYQIITDIDDLNRNLVSMNCPSLF